MKKKSKCIVIIAILIFIITSTTIKVISSEEPIAKEGYMEIKDVPGVTFLVKKSLSDVSTAVREISKNVKFIDYQTYSYKNGEDTYLLFNINQYIIVAKKGTNFNLSEGTDSLLTQGLNGIWFTPLAEVVMDGDTYMVDVEAQVVITNELYNDFYGKLVTLADGEEEWALFAGCINNKDEAMNEMVEYIASSFTYSEDTKIILDTYMVDIDDGKAEKVSIEETETENEEILIPIEPETSVESEVMEKDQDGQDNAEQPIEEPAEAPEENTFIVESNQTEYEKIDGKAYTSSIYSMLDVGDTGYTMIPSSTGTLENAYVKLTKRHSEAETKALIEEYIASGNSYYKEFEAPKGMHFEAVSYDVKYETDAASYLNITVRGLDGEDLRHRGVVYSHRTYDIFCEEELADGWHTNRICFYAVPNGCTEYVLKCGDGDGGIICAAYYYLD